MGREEKIHTNYDNYKLSRFFTYADKKNIEFVFKLNSAWWSRFYEYEWCKNFVESNDIVLDAACGVCHPLKFYLSDHCMEVHACDIDKRILSKEEIINDIQEAFGIESLNLIKEKWFNKIKFEHTSLTGLPYKDKMFNKIFCVSVLEHLNDYNNENYDGNVTNLELSRECQIYESLKEFKRVLKDDGIIVLTFDYPRINLKYLDEIVKILGLEYLDKVCFDLTDDCLYSEKYNLYCFRVVLKKVKFN